MGVKLTQEEVIRRFKEVHGARYDYSRTEYIDANENLVIICREHGEFEQSMYAHINGFLGCKDCSREKKVSLIHKISNNSIRDLNPSLIKF